MGFIRELLELIRELLECGVAGGIAIAFLVCGAYIVVCAVCGGLMTLVAVLYMIFTDIVYAIRRVFNWCKGESKH